MKRLNNKSTAILLAIITLLALVASACSPSTDPASSSNQRRNSLTVSPPATLTPIASNPNAIQTLTAAQAAVTSQASAATQTVSAWQLSSLQTSQAIQQTQTTLTIQQTSIALQATSTAIVLDRRSTDLARVYAGTPTAIAANLTAVAGTDQANNHAVSTSNDATNQQHASIESGLWWLFRLALIAAGGLFMIALLVAGVCWLFGHVHSINLRKQLEAYRSGVHSGDGQMVVFDEVGNYEPVKPYWSSFQPQINPPAIPKPQPAQQVSYSINGQQQPPLTIQSPPQMSIAATRAITLLTDAITYYNLQGIDGQAANRIPPDSAINWDADGWVKTTSSLYPHVTKRPGIGTYLTGKYRTLQALLDAIYSGAFVPSIHAKPSQPASPPAAIIPFPAVTPSRKRSNKTAEQNKTSKNGQNNQEQSAESAEGVTDGLLAAAQALVDVDL